MSWFPSDRVVAQGPCVHFMQVMPPVTGAWCLVLGSECGCRGGEGDQLRSAIVAILEIGDWVVNGGGYVLFLVRGPGDIPLPYTA